MENRMWILGASDPEMAAIEELLTEAGEAFQYATCDGCRVTTGNAYRADWVQNGTHYVECDGPSNAASHYFDHHRPGDYGYGQPPRNFFGASSIGQVWYYLLGAWRLPGCDMPTRLPGQASFDLPAGIIIHLPREMNLAEDDCEDGLMTPPSRRGSPLPANRRAFISRDLLNSAAADHCLAAAYRGECPGVDPDELVKWRVANGHNQPGE